MIQHLHDAAYFQRMTIRALERARTDAPHRAQDGLRSLIATAKGDLKAIYTAHDAVAAEARKQRLKEATK